MSNRVEPTFGSDVRDGGGARVRNSMRFAVVLFFLGVLSMITLMGGDTAEHVAVGGPEGDANVLDVAAAVNDDTAAEALTASAVSVGVDADVLPEAAALADVA